MRLWTRNLCKSSTSVTWQLRTLVPRPPQSPSADSHPPRQQPVDSVSSLYEPHGRPWRSWAQVQRCRVAVRCSRGKECLTRGCPVLQVDLHVPAVPDNFERLRSDYMVELHLKVMQHQLDQVCNQFCTECIARDYIAETLEHRHHIPALKGLSLWLQAGGMSSAKVDEELEEFDDAYCILCKDISEERIGLQMVAAFSLAMLLNRTLIMPKFVCFCDRYWYA